MREALDDVLVVGWNFPPLCVRSGAAIEIQFDQPDRKELHELASVVLVRADVALRIRALVTEHAQIDAHGRMQRDCFEEFAKIAEGVCDQQVVVAGHGVRHYKQRADVGNHHDLRKRERDSLAQLIRPLNHIAQPAIDAIRLQLKHEFGPRLRLHVGQLK